MLSAVPIIPEAGECHYWLRCNVENVVGRSDVGESCTRSRILYIVLNRGVAMSVAFWSALDACSGSVEQVFSGTILLKPQLFTSIHGDGTVAGA